MAGIGIGKYFKRQFCMSFRRRGKETPKELCYVISGCL
jgi:hypothetical protein